MITIEHNKSRRSTNDTNIHKQSLRKKTICEINHLVKTMEINHLDGWEKIRFSDPVDLSGSTVIFNRRTICFTRSFRK